jgi:hypothetical protein
VFGVPIAGLVDPALPPDGALEPEALDPVAPGDDVTPPVFMLAARFPATPITPLWVLA